MTVTVTGNGTAEPRDEEHRVALVAGASRGAGRAIALELAAAGLTVVVTGRTTAGRESDQHRPETVESTADEIRHRGGRALAVPTDHADPAQVRALAERIATGFGRLDVLVNALWGGEQYIDWDTPVWTIPIDRGLALLQAALATHLVTLAETSALLARAPEPLLVEITDGTTAYNAEHYRSNLYYDVAKTALSRVAFGLGEEFGPRGGTAVAVTPGWMRTEMMLDLFGVDEASWRDACARDPHFAITESPAFVARGVAALATDPARRRWNGRSVSAFDLSEAYGVTDADGSRPDCWRYNAEVKDVGLPADVRGYR